MRQPRPFFSLLAITLALFPFIFSTVVAHRAQNQIGALNGTVRDPNGAVIVGAQVTARNNATGEMRNVTTDGKGNFKLEKLAPGKYTVIVTRNGFKNAESSVTIEGGRAETAEIKLEVAE